MIRMLTAILLYALYSVVVGLIGHYFPSEYLFVISLITSLFIIFVNFKVFNLRTNYLFIFLSYILILINDIIYRKIGGGDLDQLGEFFSVISFSVTMLLAFCVLTLPLILKEKNDKKKFKKFLFIVVINIISIIIFTTVNSRIK